MDTYPIRLVAEEELAAFLAVDQHASHGTPMSERAHANFLARLEFGRTLAAFDGDTIVGGTGAFSFQMRVPGAMAAVAGVSLVAVLPSHRRQGILSALMRRQLADVSERGEAVAELAKVYDLALAERPVLYARIDPWCDRLLTDLHSEDGSSQQIRCVLAEDDSGPRAYAVFTSTECWDEDAGLPRGVLEVSEALATDPAATAALWDNLLSRDLVSEFHARMRPVDDPLLYLLADPRRVRSVVSDGLWVRLVDVGRALAQRNYASPVDVVIEVADELCPQNAGRWRLAAEAGVAPAGFRATCERTTAPADVVLPVWAVGAAYLGGTGLKAMANAGLITEAAPGSLAALSTAMSWEPAPWCPMTF